MATSELQTRTFKIHCDCRNDIEVTGWLVAEAIGVYHTLQIMRSVTGEHVVTRDAGWGHGAIRADSSAHWHTAHCP